MNNRKLINDEKVVNILWKPIVFMFWLLTSIYRIFFKPYWERIKKWQCERRQQQ